jgi:hypothetical protein
MTERIWSHWIEERMPRLGMYVQVICTRESTGEIVTCEGRVTWEDGLIYCLNGESPLDPDAVDLVALRWRFRISPQIRELLLVEDALT